MTQDDARLKEIERRISLIEKELERLKEENRILLNKLKAH